MITKELNERLTQTGPETPAGNFLRRYWWPVSSVVDLEKDPVQPVRLLSENLTLFRIPQGPGARGQGPEEGLGSGVWGLAAEPPTASPQPPTPNPSALRSPSPLRGQSDQTPTPARFGLIAERCAHRGLSLAYGVPQENGLRCAYHGWTYDTEGRVVDMPFEPACLPLKVKAYPVEELGGLIWAYLGPEPRPLLPRWELFVREDLMRSATIRPLPCNWVQCMDNSMDPVHFEHLHGYYWDWWNRHHGISRPVRTARHLKIEFDVFEYGVYKRRLVEDEPDDADDWVVGHPIFFPHTLVQGVGEGYGYQIRVPIDDTHTLHVRYRGRPLQPGEEPQKTVPVVRAVLPYDQWGRVEGPEVPLQDEMVWVGQGPISKRTQEHLVTSDKGVILYHNMLLENIAKVERGEDPMAIIRDPEMNYPYIHVERERDSAKMIQSGNAPDELDPVFGRPIGA